MTVNRKARPGCVEQLPDGNLKLTSIGLMHVLELATLGNTQADIARYLRISPSWMSRHLDPDSTLFDEDVAQAWEDGRHEYAQRIRKAQLALMETNAQMAIHLGKQELGQSDRQEIDITHRIQVVGTMPDYTQSAEDWARNFAPTPVAQRLVHEDIVEAEIVEVPDETRKTAATGD